MQQILFQLGIISKAIGKLLWLFIRQIFTWAWKGLRYLYKNRVEIAQHKLTVPFLIVFSVVWSGYKTFHHPEEVHDENVALNRPFEQTVDSVVVQETVVETTPSTKSQPNKTLVKSVSTWIGTPHKDGRKSKNGTDCSGFVQSVFKEVYHIELSRNSEEMFRKDVKPIDKTQLQEGDLVFFNTYGKGISHVGIYLKDGKFAHTSTSRGVVIDSMESPYYVRNYYAAGRIRDLN